MNVLFLLLFYYLTAPKITFFAHSDNTTSRCLFVRSIFTGVRYDLHRDFTAQHFASLSVPFGFGCEEFGWNGQLTQLKGPIFTYACLRNFTLPCIYNGTNFFFRNIFYLLLYAFLTWNCALCAIWSSLHYTMLSQNQIGTRAAMTNRKQCLYLPQFLFTAS